MKYFISVIVSILLSVILIACSGGSNGGGTSTPPLTFDLTCSLAENYTPFSPSIRDTASGATTTVIALHGKNGLPDATHMNDLALDLKTAGYDVVRPYMPWSRTPATPANPLWDADMCTALSYIDSLIVDENMAGKSVILLGHSLAGSIVVNYAALSNSTKPDALAVLAPGHFVNTSSNLDSILASNVAAAENMVTAGDGDVVATFQTYNQGVMQDIDATANTYLSYHSPEQFPSIKAAIPLVTVPTLWLAGLDDSITTSAKNLGIIDVVNARSNYEYREITGDHISMVGNATTEIDPWYQALP